MSNIEQIVESIPLTTLAVMLKQKRTELGVSQVKMAAQLNIDGGAPVISRYERGEDFPARGEVLERIAQLFDLTIQDLRIIIYFSKMCAVLNRAGSPPPVVNAECDFDGAHRA